MYRSRGRGGRERGGEVNRPELRLGHRTLFLFNHEALRPHGWGQIIAYTVIHGREKRPVTTQKTLALGGLRPWEDPRWFPKELRSGGGGRTAGAARGQCHLVSLERLTEQIADGIRFLSSSSFSHHLSHQILSSEGIRPTTPSVLRLPWLQLHSHQQWDLTCSLENTELGSANCSPWPNLTCHLSL